MNHHDRNSISQLLNLLNKTSNLNELAKGQSGEQPQAFFNPSLSVPLTYPNPTASSYNPTAGAYNRIPPTRQTNSPEPTTYIPLSNDKLNYRMKIIKELMKNQDKIQENHLSIHNDLINKINATKLKIHSKEIIKSTSQREEIELKELEKELKSLELRIYKEMGDLVKEQQRILEKEGFECFRVSEDAEVVNRQLWVLAPYVDALTRPSQAL
jgi:hypothetical protein